MLAQNRNQPPHSLPIYIWKHAGTAALNSHRRDTLHRDCSRIGNAKCGYHAAERSERIIRLQIIAIDHSKNKVDCVMILESALELTRTMLVHPKLIVVELRIVWSRHTMGGWNEIITCPGLGKHYLGKNGRNKKSGYQQAHRHRDCTFLRLPVYDASPQE